MFKYLKYALEEARKQKEIDLQKQRLLDRNMDYAYLEKLIQMMNENPLLRVRITTHDGATLDLNTTPKRTSNIEYLYPHDEYIEVK